MHVYVCLSRAFALGLASVGITLASLSAAEPPDLVLSACDQPFVFGFGSWEKAKELFPVQADGIHISAKDCRGGAGIAGMSVDVRDCGDWSPALTLTVTGQNQAGTLNLHLQEADGTAHVYRFDLKDLTPGQAQTLTPDYGVSLNEPSTVEKPGATPGLLQVNTLMVIGDWSGKPVDIVLSRVALTPPTAALLAGRAQLQEIRAREAQQARQEAEAKAQARRDLLATGAQHTADGPEIRQVCAVAADVIAITLQAGRHVSNELVPYVAEAGDEIVEEEKGTPRHRVTDGKVVDYFQQGLFRKTGNTRTKVGLLSPDGKWVFIEHASAGHVLDETVVDVPAAYSIQSADDPAYAVAQAPTRVFRKGKPNGYSQPLPFLYTLSLQLPSALKEGATYTVRFVGVNSARETIDYVHAPRLVRSLAVHAIQTGYRPDDPWKRAYLSFWMGVDQEGKSGSCTPDVATFELLDAAGKTVFSGPTELAKADGAAEQISIHESLDYTKAAVRRLDFSAFATPGEYRVFVPGLGVSGPFRIAAEVWERPFKAAMQGILTQRQGIELGPPACAYRRRRPLHPDDGVTFYQMTMLQQEGQEGARGEHLLELAKAGPLQPVSGIWGGYQDAGDWDTIGHHLSATYDLLGLSDLNPAAFAQMRLSLPAAEMTNDLPDLLDEALWQMPLWRRLQLPDGGVRGGYGDGWGCYKGETSAMLTYAGVYAVDHDTTLRYAAAAARTARVLAVYDQGLAAEYLESARRAWAWAEAHARDDDPTYARLKARQDWPPFLPALANARAAAAVELLAATRDPAYDAAFKQSTELVREPVLYLDQLGADFAYARLPADLGDPELKARAVARIVAYADHAIEFSRKNAYDLIAGARTDYPLIFACRYFSTPAQGGLSLIYAYELTGKPAYLAAAVQGANYSLGANPDNLSYCTGVGDQAQHFTFIVDAQVTGQLPDVIVGHIPYGQGNEGNAMSRSSNAWVQQWLLNFGPTRKMVPNWYDWPVYEQYIDFGRYPLHNENCFNQTSVPAACIWFYLHTRPAAGN
jgi:endoglucanase